MKKFDFDSKKWRNSTVIQLDGAKFQICQQTKRDLIELGFDVIYSAPHSYYGAPCELFFSQLKNSDLNPTSEKKSKK